MRLKISVLNQLFQIWNMAQQSGEGHTQDKDNEDGQRDLPQKHQNRDGLREERADQIQNGHMDQVAAKSISGKLQNDPVESFVSKTQRTFQTDKRENARCHHQGKGIGEVVDGFAGMHAQDPDESDIQQIACCNEQPADGRMELLFRTGSHCVSQNKVVQIPTHPDTRLKAPAPSQNASDIGTGCAFIQKHFRNLLQSWKK